MSNVHSLRDPKNENNNNNNNILRNYRRMNEQRNENYYNNNQDNIFLLGENNSSISPRNETFSYFLKNLLCPKFNLKSFCFYIILINSILYIITLSFGLEINSKDFLPPKTETLEKFGMLKEEKLKLKNEKILNLYRWILNSFLHSNFLHIFFNSISILIFGSLTEYYIKSKNIFIVYLLSGILGSLFSILINPKGNSVGASISVYGIFGSYISFFIIKWKELNQIFGIMGKCCNFYFFIFYIMITLFMQFSPNQNFNSNINAYGHFGGLIFGFFISVLLIKPQNSDNSIFFPYNVWKVISIFVLISFTITGFSYFYYY